MENVVGQYLRHGVPSRGPRSYVQEALNHLACRVFQPRRRRLQFVEPRERGVEVGLVEDFAAVDPVAVDRQKLNHPPLGVEALVARCHAHLGDDRSESRSADARLDVDVRSGVRSHEARRYAVRSPDANA